MHFLKNFKSTILKYDLLNKFLYTNTKKLPQLKKITLHFNCKTSNFKDLSLSLLALDLVTGKQGKITFTKKSNILLKLRKGNPVGCKVVLKNSNMLHFLTRIYTEIFPKIKNFNSLKFTKNINKNSGFSLDIKDIFVFEDMEKHYYLFNNLNKMNINFVTTTFREEELVFIFKSYKLYLEQN